MSGGGQTQDTGISIPNMDPAVRPGDNFYLYANGAYVSQTKLPPDRAALGVFNTLVDLSFKQVASIIDAAAKANPPAGSAERKIPHLHPPHLHRRPTPIPPPRHPKAPPGRNRRQPFPPRARRGGA